MDVALGGLDGGTDLEAYTAAAAHIQSGEPIYRLPIIQGSSPPNYLYPPFLALLFLAFGSYASAWITWIIVSVLCYAAILAVLLRELGPELDQCIGARGWPILWAGLLIFTPVMVHLIWGQVGLPILLCLSLAWIALQRGQDGRAGVALGIAITLKLYPVVLFVPLLVGGRFRLVGTAVLVAAALIGGSFTAISLEQTLFYLREVIPAAAAHGVGDIGNYALRDRVPFLVYAPIAVLIGAYILIIAWRRRLADAVLLSITAILLTSPLVWGHYFVLALLPWLVALARATPTQIALLALAFAGMSTASAVFYMPTLLLQQIAQWLPTLGAALLLLVQIRQTHAR